MKKGKRRVRRLALYLRSIGIKPNAAGTQSQYDQLEQEQRKLARRTGRRLLNEFGSIAKANMALINHVVQETLAGIPPRAVALNRSRHEQFLHNSSRWSPLTPACPLCKMGCGYPKRSWPSREWAEEVRGRQHDRDTLRVFSCPVQPGYFHLGHIGGKGRHVAPQNTARKDSFPSIPPHPLPAIPLEKGGQA